MKLERVEGCKLGLDSDNPTLPQELCCQPCDWRIKSPKHLNCMWLLNSDPTFTGMSLRKIAEMLGMTHESVRQILKEAQKKLPRDQDTLEEFLQKEKEPDNKKTRSDVNEDVVNDLILLLGK